MGSTRTLVLTLLIVVLEAKVAFVCPDGKQLKADLFNIPNPSVSSCCDDIPAWSTPTCASATANNIAFECNATSYNTLYNWFSTTVTQDNCCTPKTCKFYTAEAAPFFCTGGKVLNKTADHEQEPTEAKCCKAFESSCYHVTEGTRDPFPCSDGTWLNFSNTKLTIDQASCCMPFTPRCNKNVDRMTYSCPAGKVYNPSNGNTSPPSETACCKDFTPSCAAATENGMPYKCPAGKSLANTGLQMPSETACCHEPTCDNIKQELCSDIDPIHCLSGIKDTSMNDSPAFGDWCCLAAAPTAVSAPTAASAPTAPAAPPASAPTAVSAPTAASAPTAPAAPTTSEPTTNEPVQPAPTMDENTTVIDAEESAALGIRAPQLGLLQAAAVALTIWRCHC